jgi:[CysO sulfur-carrier protein]-S-L-cysteine hydrolase
MNSPEYTHDVLREETLQRIYRHACSTYPEECCGFVFADGGYIEGSNIQNDLHRHNPQVYQRTAANGYTFSVADTVLLNKSLRSPNPVTVVYHSHPDVGAYFSDEDQDKALFAGQPLLPVSYLVIDVRAAQAHGAKLFEWRGTCFVCSRNFQTEPNS